MNWFKGRFKYAFQGLFYAFTCDRSILFHCSLNEWMMLIFAIGLVWFSEIINSCIERCVDYISLEHTEQAKHIKDMAAGAVFIISMLAACIGLYVFLPKLF